MLRGMISIFKAMLLFKAVRQLIIFCQSNILIICVFVAPRSAHYIVLLDEIFKSDLRK
jgi:hypothetical protein